jgi:hypothetical protein
MDHLCLCIPRVIQNTTENQVKKIFSELNLGIIDRIDMITKNTEKGDKFKRVYVHFKKWFSNQNAREARERIEKNQEIKIIYDEPWFWKVSVYREPQKK